MYYFLAMFTLGNKTVEHGWMMAASADELVQYARSMGYGVTLTYLGEADMQSPLCRLVPGTETPAARAILAAGEGKVN